MNVPITITLDEQASMLRWIMQVYSSLPVATNLTPAQIDLLDRLLVAVPRNVRLNGADYRTLWALRQKVEAYFGTLAPIPSPAPPEA
jgi:hypothetical protein